MEQDALSLNFLALGDQAPVDVHVLPRYKISGLKQAINETRNGSGYGPIPGMLLWKLNDPLRIWKTTAEKDIFKRKIAAIRFPDPDSEEANKGNGSVQLLDDVLIISSYWDKQPGPDDLHLIAQPRKKFADEMEPAQEFHTLWEQTWNRNDEAIPWFCLTKIARDNTLNHFTPDDSIPDDSTPEDSTLDDSILQEPMSEDSMPEEPMPEDLTLGAPTLKDPLLVPEYVWVFSPPDPVAKVLDLDPGTVLVRDDYRRVLCKLLECSGWSDFTTLPHDFNTGAMFYNPFSTAKPPHKPSRNGFILTGHPGIGKSIWLRILLILRLCARLPTFYQVTDSRTVLFTKNGPVMLRLDTVALDHHMKVEHAAWALVDSTLTLKIPPPEFMAKKIFVVHTPSPHPDRVGWRDKYLGIELCCLALWSPAEIICAAPFQLIRHSEKSLINFCKDYGWSARDAYSKASKPQEIEQRIKNTKFTYEAASEMISEVGALDFSHNISHRILCITPAGNHLGYTFHFVSKHVYKSVCTSLSEKEVDPAVKLYRLFCALGKTRSVAGYMLEDAMHGILGGGGTWAVIPLVQSKGQKNIRWKTPDEYPAAYLHFTSCGISVNANSEDNILAEGRPRSLELPIGRLCYYAYYKPRSKTQATYDAIIYDPERKHAWIFQSTVSPNHTVKLSGINDLLARGVEEITYVAVTPPDSKINLPFSNRLNRLVKAKYQLQLL